MAASKRGNNRDSVTGVIQGAIKASGKTFYMIGKHSKINPTHLTNFADGDSQLISDAIDRLAAVLRLVLVPKDEG
jgi:hypothetical protein